MKSRQSINWCLKQKRGIKLEKPNENLSHAYLKKAKSSLNMLDSAINKNEIDWIATTAYYARYFAFYALLQKLGIKSEIHDCTMRLMKLFIDEKIIGKHYFKGLVLAKELREDTQYYVIEEFNIAKLKKEALTAKDFVLMIEETCEKINGTQIDKIRNKLKN